MPQLVKKRRSGWAVLAVGALVASLLAAGASPVGADTDTADNSTKLSACVGDATADKMFTDVSDDHAFRDAINCIAYYGVTKGTGDGSTFSPNDDVSRQAMALFIARTAEAAGVDLGDAMDAGFSDINDAWDEARQAINRLASKGMIPKGDTFRPNDAITRAEMATFLIGLLNKAASNVTIDSAGAIQLGAAGSTAVADDYFADARSSLPRANDAEVSALYELGVTKGSTPAAVQDDTKPPLDTNYEPDATVTRGAMAAFITRALAHTSVRPEGVSAQHDSGDVVVSVRDDKFQPMANVVIDLFRADTGGVDLAFRANGTCGEVAKVSDTGTYACEIDGADPITGAGGDTSVALGDVDRGGTTVWVWTGDDKATVDSDTGTFQLDVPEGASDTEADRVRVSTEFAGTKAHLGSSVLYTVQLQDAKGDVTVGVDGKKPASFFVTLTTYAIVETTPDDDEENLARNPQGSSVRTTLPLTTDADGKATFSVSGLPDRSPGTKADKYQVDIHIQADPDGNAPANTAFYIDDAVTAATPSNTGIVTVREGATTEQDAGGLMFSTQASDRTATGATVSVKPAADFVASSVRGASNRVTVTVTDQYGDPIAGARVSLATNLMDDGEPLYLIGGGRAFAVGRDGSYTFGYEREAAGAATETLTATWVHDDDDATDDLEGTDTVEWAAAAAASGTDEVKIRAFDTETNTIFVGDDNEVAVLSYDSNDRFNIKVGTEDAAASTYAAFERGLSKADGYSLDWNISVTGGSRAVNAFTLNTPAPAG